jgi:hypothetical protein
MMMKSTGSKKNSVLSTKEPGQKKKGDFDPAIHSNKVKN